MDRYSRNILVEGIGAEGQAKLAAARVLVIGGGGLGSPVLLYLAAAGVGTLGVVDFDVVDVTNLQRQILHFTEDVGVDKTVSAGRKLRALNPETEVVEHPVKFTEENAEQLVAAYDFVVDCSDNYRTKFLIDDTCVKLQKPYCHGSVVGMRGEIMTYVPGGASYRDVFGGEPDKKDALTSATEGILGAAAGIMGSIQATEAIKYITGTGRLLTDRLLIVDAREMFFRVLDLI